MHVQPMSGSRPLSLKHCTPSRPMQAIKPTIAAARIWTRASWYSVSTQATTKSAAKIAATEPEQPIIVNKSAKSLQGILDKDILSKKDVIDAISLGNGLDVTDVAVVVDGLISIISNAVAEDKSVRVTGLGTFKRTHRTARTGRNPRSGEALQIAETALPTFTASKLFKDVVKAEFNKSSSTPPTSGTSGKP